MLATLFIFSGFVKAVDPLGSFYKIQDYLAAFGIISWFPTYLPLLFAIILSSAEFCVGVFLFFRCTPEDCVDLGASPDERNDSVDLVSCFGKSRIRLRMLWRCVGVDELADIREEHRIADCGDSGIPGAETHVPLRYAEDRMDGVLIHAFVCLCTFFFIAWNICRYWTSALIRSERI